MEVEDERERGMWGVEGEGDGEGNVRSDEEREEGECGEWRVREMVRGM